MKDSIANQLVKYLEARGVEHLFGLCGHTNIAVLAALEKSTRSSSSTRATSRSPRTRPTATRARRSKTSVRAVAPRARAHQRRDRRGQRGARLDPDGGDRRRRADALLRQASAPGSEPARRRVAVRDLPAVRQARLARRSAATCSPRSSRRRSRSPRAAGPGRCWSTCRWTSSRRRSTSRCSSALRHNTKSLHKPSLDEETADEIVQALLAAKHAGALRRRRHPARRRGRRAARVRRPPADSGRAHADGQGRAARRPSADARHDRASGARKFINDKCRGADWILGLGTRFSEADCSSWEPRVHVQHPADQADPHRHRSGGDRPQLSRSRSARSPT